MTFEDGLKLVKLRGEAMQEAAEASKQLMLSVGGPEKAINLLQPKCEKAGALQAKVLKTGGAFHTQLMQPAQVKLNAALDETVPKMSPPKTSIYMNASSDRVKA